MRSYKLHPQSATARQSYQQTFQPVKNTSPVSRHLSPQTQSSVFNPKPIYFRVGEVIKTGWGADFYENGKPLQFPKVLKKLKTKVVTDEECRKSTDELEIPHHSMCSFQDGESTCAGDSGGPVFKLINNLTLIQVGLNSGFVTDTYENICHKQISVSTKISPFVGWIHRRIQGCGNYPLRPERK